MKKLILGLLSAAIIILSFTACQQSSTPTVTPVVVPHSPTITGAVFFEESDYDSNGITWGTAQQKKKTTLSASKNYRLGVYFNDALSDVNDIAISTNSSFTGTYWHYTFTPGAFNASNGVWFALVFALKNNSELRDIFTNRADANLYLKITDAAGNTGTYTISGITITD
ncbi:MAG: hypothetical protein K6A15_01085 [Treponema sp.]|nr:hypothetical protein [Treponema sp.]